MKLLRESKTMDEIDEWGEKYTLVNNGGTIIADYSSNDIIYPGTDVHEFPFRAIVEDLIGLGYHLFEDDVKSWEDSIEYPYFMEFGLKEIDLPKPEHANLLHIGWMVYDSDLSNFYCACQNPKDFDIILKSAVPFLCPRCKQKRERWFGGGYDFEDWLIKDGFSLDSEYMRKWVNILLQHSEDFVKESFVEFLNKTHFNSDRLPYGDSTYETLSRKDARNLAKLFEKDIQKVKNPATGCH